MGSLKPTAARGPLERSMLYGKRTPLVGVMTYAESPEPVRPCILVLNSGIIHKVGPGRLTIKIARSLAEAGFDVFRFDFAGVGDSPARNDGLSLADGVVSDVVETMDHLEENMGHKRFVIVGLCSGADNGMRAAEHDARVVGLVQLDPTIDRTWRWYWEHCYARLSSARLWMSILTLRHERIQGLLARLQGKQEPEQEVVVAEKPELFEVAYSDRRDLERCLAGLLAREVQLFVAFTGSWAFIYNYPRQFYDVYPALDFSGRLDLHHRPRASHMYYDESERNWLLDALVRWASENFAGLAPARAGADLPLPDDADHQEHLELGV